jgi:hypothetical protein
MCPHAEVDGVNIRMGELTKPQLSVCFTTEDFASLPGRWFAAGSLTQ